MDRQVCKEEVPRSRKIHREAGLSFCRKRVADCP